MVRRMVLTGTVAAGVALAAMAEKPEGWTPMGQAPFDFVMELDRDMKMDGEASVRIAAKSDSPKGFATLMQEFFANDFQGKRIRFRGHVKSEAVSGKAGLWMRVDDADGKTLAFDNMSTRPIKGDSDWTAYDIVLDIPIDAEVIALGVMLDSAGSVWLDACSFEEVLKDVPVTDMIKKKDPDGPAAPVNLGLEP